MCNQAIGLVAAEIEKRGIPTVCLQLLREVAEKVRPPRSLFVPFAHGYALGEAHNAALQQKVILAALELLSRSGPPPLLEEFEI